MLADPVRVRVDGYLRAVDAALPGRVDAFYVVGSVALGAFRAGRSDIDFLAVIGGEAGLAAAELARLRAAQRRAYDREAVRSLTRLRWPLVCNGCFVRAGDLALAPGAITPVASHVARRFTAGAGFDVNPVTWEILATRGIAVRGPDPRDLHLHRDAAVLRQWNLDNLNTYWARWARAVRRPGPEAVTASLRHLAAAWGALGAPRLHYTIATGAIATKEQAGEYALDVFDPRWHPVVRAALAYWRGEGGSFVPVPRQRGEAAAFVEMVIDSANRLPLPSP